MSGAPPEAEALGWFDQLSNWGRWGPDDEAGTLNLIDAAAVRRGVACAVDGCAVSLALDVVNTLQPGDLVHGAPHRFMVRTGRDRGSRLDAAAEFLGMVFHGPNITHLDALCHTSWDGKLYNGRSPAEINVESGAQALDVTAASKGIVTRGVLFDVAHDRGVEWLPHGTAVEPEELEAFEERHGVRVGPGDAVLLRTGHGRYRRVHGAVPMSQEMAGWSPSVLPWFKSRDVALAGSDGWNEATPNGYADLVLPVHAVGQVALGLWLLDNCDLERLSSECEASGRYEFLFSIAPLRVRGGTGSPVNPLAVL
jgi:kynurenine formamidase